MGTSGIWIRARSAARFSRQVRYPAVIYRDTSEPGTGISFAPPRRDRGSSLADLFPQTMTGAHSNMPAATSSGWIRWCRPALPLVVVTALLCLGGANIKSRAAWREVEDGALWLQRAEGVVAGEISRATPAAEAGL